MTPSQAAHKYAGDNGFKIEPNGRRYIISYPAAQFDTFVAEVGGYPAALNAMKAYVKERDALPVAAVDYAAGPDRTVFTTVAIHTEPRVNGAFDDFETCAGGSLVLPEPGVGPVAWTTKTADEIRVDIVAGVAMLTQRSNDLYIANVGRGVELDELGERYRMRKRRDGETDQSYRNLFIYGDERGIKGVYYPFEPLKIEALLTPDAKWEDEPIIPQPGEQGYIERDRIPFDDFDSAAQARIRQAANRITRQRRKTSGKPPGGPWRITYNVKIAERGFTRADYNAEGFPSRAAALAKVRYLLSDRLTGTWWKKTAVTVEYRAS